MGRDATILAKHHVAFQDDKLLVEQLAHLFSSNITLGFVSYIDLSADLKLIDFGSLELDYVDCFELLSVELNAAFPKSFVLKRDYLYTWLYEKYGEKAGSLPEFKAHWTQDDAQALSIIKEYMAEPSSFNFFSEAFKFSIHQHILKLNHCYTLHRWWGFFRNTLKRDYYQEDDQEVLLKEINKIRDCAKLMGATDAWYLDNQSDILEGIGFGAEDELEWDEIVIKIKSLVGEERIINIRRCIFDADYLAMINEKIGDDENYKKYPAFYDDFKEYNS